MRKLGLGAAFCLLAFAGPAVAGDLSGGLGGGLGGGFGLPNGGFFGGLGGSYNAINFGTQNVYAVGTSNTYQNGVLVATGSAAGPANVYVPSQMSFAPSAQFGYFQHFTASNWLWGVKFSYAYLNTTAATSGVLLPQAGSFTSGGTTTPFTGNAVVGSFQTSINDQMSLLLFAGRAFDRGFFYLGAGPTLALTQTNLNNVVGFADINGAHTDISGTPTSLSSSGWVWGGAVQIGVTYFLDPTWFLDVNYTYSMTANQTASFNAPFTNPTATEIGTLSGTSMARVVGQALTVSINKAFSWGAY